MFANLELPDARTLADLSDRTIIGMLARDFWSAVQGQLRSLLKKPDDVWNINFFAENLPAFHKELKEEIDAFVKKTYEEFVSEFELCYQFLKEGESTFLNSGVQTNFLKKLSDPHMSAKEKVECILKHKEDNPESRTAQAVEIMFKNADDKERLKQAYHQGKKQKLGYGSIRWGTGGASESIGPSPLSSLSPKPHK
jgi:hypothetical protein